MNLEQLREEINVIDDKLVALFQDRMDVASKIAEYKKQNNIPVLDAAIERKKMANIVENTKDDMASYISVLYSLLFELSRSYQERILNPTTDLKEKITAAIENTDKLFPKSAIVACQGVEGAYSQLACEKIFATPNIMYFNTFDAVFSAIDKGLCKYGILPVENSTAGSVNAIYDLMMDYNFSIVKSVRLKVDHNLLAKKGAKLSDIKEIYSHEQAISQCAEFIKSLGNVKVNVVENTAIAAKMVAEKNSNEVAALSSRSCAKLYDLDVLAKSVQDKGNNFTRFICISKNLEIYPGSNRTSIMVVTPHKPGALYKLLSRFYALGINLVKIESRPIPDRDFEFSFYFDLETSVYSQEFIQLICELEGLSEEFKYLGSYVEEV